MNRYVLQRISVPLLLMGQLVLQPDFVFPQLGVLRFRGVLGERESAELGPEGVHLLSVLLLDVPRDLGLIHDRRVRYSGTGELDDGPEACLTDRDVIREEGR